jgi:hypothetical protein
MARAIKSAEHERISNSSERSFFIAEPMIISRFQKALLVLGVLMVTSVSFSQVFMDADSAGDAYARFLSKKYGYEVPDCKHAVRHITEEWDAALKKHVFVFGIHRDLDDDRCINFDRQRSEIKTDASSPDTMKAAYGETHTSVSVSADSMNLNCWRPFLGAGVLI